MGKLQHFLLKRDRPICTCNAKFDESFFFSSGQLCFYCAFQIIIVFIKIHLLATFSLKKTSSFKIIINKKIVKMNDQVFCNENFFFVVITSHRLVLRFALGCVYDV